MAVSRALLFRSLFPGVSFCFEEDEDEDGDVEEVLRGDHPENC